MSGKVLADAGLEVRKSESIDKLTVISWSLFLKRIEYRIITKKSVVSLYLDLTNTFKRDCYIKANSKRIW